MIDQGLDQLGADVFALGRHGRRMLGQVRRGDDPRHLRQPAGGDIGAEGFHQLLAVRARAIGARLVLGHP